MPVPETSRGPEFLFRIFAGVGVRRLHVGPETIADFDAPQLVLVSRPVDQHHLGAAQLLQVAGQRADAVTGGARQLRHAEAKLRRAAVRTQTDIDEDLEGSVGSKRQANPS